MPDFVVFIIKLLHCFAFTKQENTSSQHLLFGKGRNLPNENVHPNSVLLVDSIQETRGIVSRGIEVLNNHN